MQREIVKATHGLPPGYEVFYAPYRDYHLARAHLAKAVQRGELAALTPWQSEGELVYCTVQRLRPPAPRWPKYAAIAVGVTAVLGILAALTYAIIAALPLILGGLAAAAALLLVASAVTRRPFAEVIVRVWR